jgi:hypothetical protein
MGEHNHWSERGRAMSVGNSDTLGRPRRSVRSFDITFNRFMTSTEAIEQINNASNRLRDGLSDEFDVAIFIETPSGRRRVAAVEGCPGDMLRVELVERHPEYPDRSSTVLLPVSLAIWSLEVVPVATTQEHVVVGFGRKNAQ